MILEAVLPGAILGLASSAHCAGMCGVFATQASGCGTGCGPGARAKGLGLFVLGKTCTYAFLGAVAGTAGVALGGLGTGVRATVTVLAAVALILVGIHRIHPFLTGIRFQPTLPPAAQALGRIVRNAHATGGNFAFGLAVGFIPCGVVYLAALQGVALGDAGLAVLWMIAFGIGTAPVLGVVGWLAGGLFERLSPTTLRRTGGALLLLTGLVALYRALPVILAASSGEPVPCCH